MTTTTELRGTCHCGNVGWKYIGVLESATACNCTSCRRWGGLWVYGSENEEITTSGSTSTYVRGSNMEYHFCPRCAGVAFWSLLRVTEEGKRPMAVNLRMAEPEAVGHLPIDHLERLHSFEDLHANAAPR